MKINNKILITGASGLIGSSLVKLLQYNGFKNLLTPKSSELDLRNQKQVNDYFDYHKPEYVFHLAAVVGGIKANSTLPAKFIYDNTVMHSNVIDTALRYNIKKILFPGSACTYPKFAEQPVTEDKLYSGSIEPTNIAYATAKLNGIIMCQSYAKQHGLNAIIPMPTNAYGINDHFNLENSHVIPALIMKFHNAKMENKNSVDLWGSGKPLREFIFADDLADALLFLMNNYDSSEIINVSTMEEISIFDLALLIKDIVGFSGHLNFNPSEPDGIMRKCLNSSKLFSMGWKPSIKITEGIAKVYQHFIATQNIIA